MSDARSLRDLSDDELTAHLASARRDLFGLRFQHATGDLENTAALGASKRALARALTVARRRALDATDRTEN